MNEERKILELVQNGTLTAEEGETLLAAIQTKRNRPSRPFRESWRSGAAVAGRIREKIPVDEIRKASAQFTANVTQSLGEVKRTLEQHIESWSNPPSTLMATWEKTAELDGAELSVETFNGQIQVSTWDQPQVRIVVRGQVKTDSMPEANQRLSEAIQYAQTGNVVQVAVVHTSSSHIVAGHVDVLVPQSTASLHLRSQGGNIHVDHVATRDIHAQTTHGAIRVFNTTAERFNLFSTNGGIDLRSSLKPVSRSVYASTKNGRILVDGIDENGLYVGTAKALFGRVDVQAARLVVNYDDASHGSATFQTESQPETESGLQPTTVHLESRHGGIRMND